MEEIKSQIKEKYDAIKSIYKSQLLIHKLTENMRLKRKVGNSDSDRDYNARLENFKEFQKNVAKGTSQYFPSKGKDFIKIPNE